MDISVTSATDERIPILGVDVWNVDLTRAMDLLEQKILEPRAKTTRVYFVNAHTLNLACKDPSFREVLNRGDYVFGDGTGIRWAARMKGKRIKANLVGTDFIPSLFQAKGGKGYSYFLLGSDASTIEKAAAYAREHFPGWNQVGYHHGYLKQEVLCNQVLQTIRSLRPDMLLVGMGNPLQEQWIDRFSPELNIPLCLGIGGLYDYWAENVSRAPQWLRRAGHEWVWRLFQQPRDKAKRYLIGNPLFLFRLLREKLQRKNPPCP